jgi:hypothetical protein
MSETAEARMVRFTYPRSRQPTSLLFIVGSAGPHLLKLAARYGLFSPASTFLGRLLITFLPIIRSLQIAPTRVHCGYPSRRGICRGYMVVKVAVIITLLTLTACREEQRSLPIVDAASTSLQAISYKQSTPDIIHGSMRKSGIDMQRITIELNKTAPPQYCYSFVGKRPREQRADAVQARLAQADRMVAAFEPELLSVDLIGDHANILSLEFSVDWPDASRVSQVSSIVEEYLASVDIEDYMCGAGFAEVQLSARSLADQHIHTIWSARVTSEGLLKSTTQQASLR